MAKHAKHARKEDESAAEQQAPFAAAADRPDGQPRPEAPEFDAASEHHRKSRRMRIVLTVVSVVLVALMAALAYFGWMLVNEASDVATRSAAQTKQADANDAASTSDAGKSTAARKETPRLVGLIGKTEEEAVEAIGRGATETSSKDVTEETGEGDDKTTEVVGRSVTLALTDETTDSKGNTPSVYLTLDSSGAIVEAGYSASVGSLGYGDVSFVDAVKSEHIVENLVSMAGVEVAQGSVEMPATSDYRTYADDGTTIAQEVYTFTGSGQASDGASYSWSCKLSYDYSAANVSSNLSDTIRQVYVYVKAA